jgi:anti-anti-sigma factor
MAAFSDVFKIYQAGPLTVVGFSGTDLPQYERVVTCRNDLSAYLKSQNCRTLAFDLTGVPFIPSGILGVLVSLRQEGFDLLVYNPSPAVQDVLSVTKLDQVIDVRHIDMA